VRLNKDPYFDLDAMRSVDIRTVDPATLKEISDTIINPDLPFAEKALDYMRQIGNAYCFRHGGVAVKVNHSQSGGSINDCMEGFIRSFD
jgi:hypothetical protein